MKIDLRKLYSLKRLELNENLNIPPEYYKNLDIISLKNLSLSGEIFINIEDEIEIDATLKGTFILPCSITLEEVEYDFITKISEIITENNEKHQFSLDILDVLWENIVSEVPMKVTKPCLETKNIKGSGWELK